MKLRSIFVAALCAALFGADALADPGPVGFLAVPWDVRPAPLSDDYLRTWRVPYRDLGIARRGRGRRFNRPASTVVAAAEPFVNTLSIDLDGVDQMVERADENALSCTTSNEFTMCSWVLLDAPTATNRTIAAKWDFATQGEWAIQTLAGGVLFFAIADALTDNASNEVRAPGGTIVAGWQFVCAWYDGSGAANRDKAKIYHNATDVTSSDSGALPATLQNGTATMKFGQFGGTLSRYWGAGNLDEACFWCTALSGADITTLYNSGTPIDCTTVGSPVVALRMGDGDTHPTVINRGSAGNFTAVNTVAGDFVEDVAP